ncbi:hypothetical protein BDN70DRAFT_892855 [Pholiota conissans]|uniref:Uncharacterized protein n=1 Tax=Pholiota conissans TaxID=109636 RepID=A0A9P5Z6T8_9AGAR|nr:hypothetical protein BDN70DRAFT_892855 [Pholiota conissans]
MNKSMREPALRKIREAAAGSSLETSQLRQHLGCLRREGPFDEDFRIQISDSEIAIEHFRATSRMGRNGTPLFGPSFTDPVSLTVESCANFCNGIGNRMAGLQGTQCSVAALTTGHWRFSNFYKEHMDKGYDQCPLRIWYKYAVFIIFLLNSLPYPLSIHILTIFECNAVNLHVPLPRGNLTTAACTTTCGNAGKQSILSDDPFVHRRPFNDTLLVLKIENHRQFLISSINQALVEANTGQLNITSFAIACPQSTPFQKTLGENLLFAKGLLHLCTTVEDERDLEERMALLTPKDGNGNLGRGYFLFENQVAFRNLEKG